MTPSTTPSTPPPPPWPAAASPPPPGAPPTARPPRRPWRERLPEVVAVIGALLVVLALAGFASSTWDVLGAYGRAVTLGATAAGLTVAGLWADQSGRRTVTTLAPTLWATGTAVLVAAVHVALLAAMPDAGRVVVAMAGASGIAHGAVLWRRRPDAVPSQLATVGAAVFAAGPVGTALGDTYRANQLPELVRPLAGVLDPTVESNAFALVAIAHLVVAVAWLGLSRTLPLRAARTARIGGSALVGYAAMELNVLEAPIGAAVALLVVLGYLLAGLVLDDLFLVVVGTVGALATGVKVIWALFSGEVAVTLTVFTVGLAMLGWALRTARNRDAADQRAG